MRPDRDRLPSWSPGSTRDGLLAFLDDAAAVPVQERLACFDCDGTLWCEKPGYVQFGFFLATLRERAAADPALAEREEYGAVLGGDQSAVGALGLGRVAAALAELYDGLTPAEFSTAARAYVEAATHDALGRPVTTVVYQPMLELIAALRAADFTVAIVTGGGTEFVRAVSEELYGVPPELVVGTLIGYELKGGDPDHPRLRRTASLMGGADEGPAKVKNIQTQLGRGPIFAAGNSGGDREMLAWASAGTGPRLALLVDHDDGEREFAYTGTAATFADPEPITEVADRLGWLTASMAHDWVTVFPPTAGA